MKTLAVKLYKLIEAIDGEKKLKVISYRLGTWFKLMLLTVI